MRGQGVFLHGACGLVGSLNRVVSSDPMQVFMFVFMQQLIARALVARGCGSPCEDTLRWLSGSLCASSQRRALVSPPWLAGRNYAGDRRAVSNVPGALHRTPLLNSQRTQ